MRFVILQIIKVWFLDELMTDLVLKHGRVVSETCIVEADVVISGGKISEIVPFFEGQTRNVLNCADKYILPGAIDVHVHFRTPGHEYKEDWDSGSRAALSGGVTTVFDMPNNSPPIINSETLDMKRRLISGKSWVNYALYIGATVDNIDELTDVSGVCGVKIYMGSSTGDILVADKDRIEDIFKHVSDNILCFHAETEALLKNTRGILLPEMHSKLRSIEAVLDAVSFVLTMALKYKRRVHICHVSTTAEVELIASKKNRFISCEVTPHHLFFDESVYARLGNFVKVNPPLRKSSDRHALWRYLKEGVIDMIATDHAPHLISEKENPYYEAPAGMPGLDTMLPLFLNEVSVGNLTLEEIARYTSSNPARCFGLKDRGSIEVGLSADLVVVDMDERKKVENDQLQTKCRWSAFEGWGLRGWPYATIVNGKLSYLDGKFVGKPCGEDLFSC